MLIKVLFSLLAFLSFSVQAFSVEKIKVGLHFTAPWAYMNEHGEVVGIEKDIIEEIFNNMGYETEFSIYGHRRLLKEIETKRLDFASPVVLPFEGITYSDRYLPFKDVAISLKSNNYQINTIEDLGRYNVVAYETAQTTLGPVYKKVTDETKGAYVEMFQRENQIRMLFKKHADVLIGDVRILKFFADKSYGSEYITVHDIFPETHYSAAAWDPKYVEIFNKGLAALKASGRFDEIVNKKRH